MIYIFLALIIAVVALQLVILAKSGKDNNLDEKINRSIVGVSDIISKNQREIGNIQSENLKSINTNINDRLMLLEKRFESLEHSNNDKMSEIRITMENRLEQIEKTNSAKLDNMREVVDEKLQKTLETKMNESFNLVNERLKQVYEGLGEMKTLASGVGDLKKVLSNVKTRGILGEIQLGAILEEILAPEQYETNVATVRGSRNMVEFAVKLPGDGDKTVYLPIDSKFPSDAYIKLREAYDNADADAIKTAKSELISRIKSFAKDIRTKYIEVPYTTDFGIMFLPSEGLYAEVVNLGLVEVLQRDYRINIAGPSTMAAMLNSLRMGFKTLAIQKRSAQVWEILGAVKTEFDKFGDILEKTQTKLNQINTDLDKLVGARTNAIKRKLRNVESLSDEKTAEFLESDE